MADRFLETLDGSSWSEFAATGVAVLVLGKSDCAACATWTAELTEFLAAHQEFSDVRVGKLLLDQRGLIGFKRENAAWLKELDVLPYNLIYRDGAVQKQFAGSGVDRLVNRLRALRG